MTSCTCSDFPAALGNVTFEANVGMGLNPPLTQLHVAGTILVAGNQARVTLARNDSSDPTTTKTWQLDNASNTLRIFQQPNLNSSGTVYMVIQDGGYVGIGTTTPAAPLHVLRSSPNAQITIENPTSGATDTQLVLKTPDREWHIGENVGGVLPNGLVIWDIQAGAARLVINTSGYVGIGTTAPQQVLDVAGTVRCTGVLLGGNMLLYWCHHRFHRPLHPR